METLIIVGVIALGAGILVGIYQGKSTAKGNHGILEQRNKDLNEQVQASAILLGKVMAQSEARAGFESLAKEREASILQMKREKEELQRNIEAKTRQEHLFAATISRLETELKSERQNMAEKIALLDKAKQTLADQFQTLATEIIEQKSRIFSEGSQKELGVLLNPLREQIKEFRDRVDKVQTESTTGVTELKTLIGALGNLNQALTEEAHNLSTALRRDTKMQGNWGETILRNILEKSGLQEGLHYSFQQSFVEVDEDGKSGQRRQTDVVVKVPGGHHLIIDSKVSLNAYNDSVNAENEKDRAEALKKHLASVRSHYNELSNRSYQSLPGLESPDFVVMFVPIEPAFLLALQGDENIWFDAYQKRVLLCGPTTVLFVLRIVVDLWRQEQQARNVRDVMKRGSLLYDKFVSFVADMEKIGKSLQSAKDVYSDAMDKLTSADGNLIGQVEKLKKLGVRSAKSLPKNLLDRTDVEEPGLALAAEAEESPVAES